MFSLRKTVHADNEVISLGVWCMSAADKPAAVKERISPRSIALRVEHPIQPTPGVHRASGTLLETTGPKSAEAMQ